MMWSLKLKLILEMKALKCHDILKDLISYFEQYCQLSNLHGFFGN